MIKVIYFYHTDFSVWYFFDNYMACFALVISQKSCINMYPELYFSWIPIQVETTMSMKDPWYIFYNFPSIYINW